MIPASAAARLQLGLAWADAGEAERALEQFNEIDAGEVPDIAAHVTRAEAMRTQQRSDAGYVRHLFDQFSADYDTRMRGQLGYQAPEILRELAGLVMMGRHDLVALDLGCGTGFAAEAFADMVAAIDGIDLSPAMIEKARARGIYRNLAVADIETALADGGADYDLILAADAFVYFGDLAPTFASVARRLKPGGFFLFTVETSTGADFELGPKRRWRHTESYLRQLAETADSTSPALWRRRHGPKPACRWTGLAVRVGQSVIGTKSGLRRFPQTRASRIVPNMVAVKSAFAPVSDLRNRTAFTAPIVLLALLGSVLLAAGILLLESRDGTGLARRVGVWCRDSRCCCSSRP